MGIWIPDLVDYYNKKLPSIQVDGKPVNVLYSQPDIATQSDIVRNLPEINFRVYNILPDKNRYRSDILLMSTDASNIVYTKKSPEPFDIYLQFVLSAEYMDDVVQMETQMTSLFPPRGIITVTDLSPNDSVTPSNTTSDKDLDMFLVDYRPMDFELFNTVRQGQIPMRLFRRMYRYLVRVEQDVYPWVSTNATYPNNVAPSATPNK